MPEIFPLTTGSGQATLNGNGMLNAPGSDNGNVTGYYSVPVSRDGLDLVFFANPMNQQLADLETRMIDVMANANLSDVQKQFTLQQLMNTWSAVSQGLTNMLKAVADVNKAIVRNIE